GLTIEQLIDEVKYDQVSRKMNTCYIHSVLAALLYKDWGKVFLKEIITIADGSIKISLNMNQFSNPGPTHLLTPLNDDKRPRLVQVFEAALVGFFGRRRKVMGTVTEVLQALGLRYDSLLEKESDFTRKRNKWERLKTLQDNQNGIQIFNFENEMKGDIDLVKNEFITLLLKFDENNSGGMDLILNELVKYLKLKIGKLVLDQNQQNLTSRRKIKFDSNIDQFRKILAKRLKKFKIPSKKIQNNFIKNWDQTHEFFQKAYTDEAEKRMEAFLSIATPKITQQLQSLNPRLVINGDNNDSMSKNINSVIENIGKELESLAYFLPELSGLPGDENRPALFSDILEKFKTNLSDQYYFEVCKALENDHLNYEGFIHYVFDMLNCNTTLIYFCQEKQTQFLSQVKQLSSDQNHQGLQKALEVYTILLKQNYKAKLIAGILKAIEKPIKKLYTNILPLYKKEFDLADKTIKDDCLEGVNSFLSECQKNRSALVYFNQGHWMAVINFLKDAFVCYDKTDSWDVINISKNSLIENLTTFGSQGYEGYKGVNGDLISILPPKQK
ncbi:MAG: hypothetical protein V2B13_05920, partial [Pseudomonadota bacterium]